MKREKTSLGGGGLTYRSWNLTQTEKFVAKLVRSNAVLIVNSKSLEFIAKKLKIYLICPQKK